MVLCCVLYVQKVDISNTQVCVYCMCRQEFRVQLEMDTANHMGLLLNLPPSPLSPSPPPYLSIQSADINTDLYSFAQCELQHGERREKGQKGQERTERIRLSWLLGCCLLMLCFSFCYIRSGKQRQTKRGRPFSKQ